MFSWIGVIVLFVMVFRLRARVRELEERSIQQPSQPQPSSTASTRVDFAAQQLQQSRQVLAHRSGTAADRAVKERVYHSMPRESFDLWAWLKEDWIMKLGALLILIGIGWFVSLAFLNNWIGPVGRIALGIGAGVAMTLLGNWRMRTHKHQGAIFMVVGSTTLLLTIFAARSVYDFFTPLSALVVMFLAVAFVAVTSVRYSSKPLALVSLVLAALAPALLESPEPDYILLFAYLLVVVLGTIWIVVLRGWQTLVFAALLIVFLYSSPHIFGTPPVDGGTMDILLLIAYVFTGLFFVITTRGMLVQHTTREDLLASIFNAVGTGLFVFLWTRAGIAEEWQSLVVVAWMLVFVIGAFLVFKASKRREPFFIYAAVGAGLLAAATALELEGAALTIAYTIEVGVLVLLTQVLLHDARVVDRVSWLLIGPVILSFESIVSRAWRSGIVHEDFFVVLLLAIMLLAVGFFLGMHQKGRQGTESAGTIWKTVGSLYVYALIWLILHASSLSDDTATMFALIVYTLVGLISYFKGRMRGLQTLKVHGAVVLLVVVGRLLLVDVWEMALTGRVITFVLIGALLMSTAFFGKRKQVRS